MNCIVKQGDTYKIESSTNIVDLGYEAKQKLIKDIKLLTGFKYAYVNKNNEIINCEYYDCLDRELKIQNYQLYNEVKLVIQ